MLKLSLLFIAILGSCVLSEGLRCCTCSNGKTIDVSYRECRDNSSCKWICTAKRCGPIFLNPSADEGPPNVTSSVWTYHVFQDDPIRISCKISSNPEANVTWLFNGKDIRSDPIKKNHFTVKFIDCGSIILTTKRAQISDKGLFTCVAQNAKGFGNHTTKVDVIKKKVSKPTVIDISIDTKDHKAYLGTTFNLSCTVSFNPLVVSIPQIAFMRHGKKVNDVPGKYENFPWAVVIKPQRIRKLSLKNVSSEEEGVWGCYGIENGISGDQKRMNLKIVPCPAGYFCPWNESRKYECPYGTYSDGSTNITYQCTKCPGKYPSTKPNGYSGPAKSIHECPVKAPCPPGYFCPWNESRKYECPYGTYSDGSTNSTYQCTKCPGKYPSTKPNGYPGPAKSIQECPVKVPEKSPVPNKDFIIGMIVVFIFVVLLLGVLLLKFRKQCSRLIKTISVNNLNSEPELVINDVIAMEAEQNLFTLATDRQIPEFPILYDVFISYSSKDVTFATEIQRELESQDFKCCIHIRDFTPGDTILNNISNAIYGSRVTLAILSPDFVESEWCKGELQQALTRSMRDHRVIPILYKNCQIPTELLHRTYIDYENCYVKPYFWEQLKRVLDPLKSTEESDV